MSGDFLFYFEIQLSCRARQLALPPLRMFPSVTCPIVFPRPDGFHLFTVSLCEFPFVFSPVAEDQVPLAFF